jgi:hypothetical protein
MYYCGQDILEYLMNSVGGGAQDSEHRVLRAAAHHAHRDVTHARDWNWHITTATLTAPMAGAGPGYSYVLPANVRNVDSIIPPINSPSAVKYVTPTEWERINIVLPSLNSPLVWTVVKHPTLPGRWVLKVVGDPDTTQTLTFTYRRKPAPLRYMGYEAASRDGSLSTSGLVKRYGTATVFPEGPAGINPYTAEEIIGVAGTLVGSPPAGAKTVVSDYLDVSDTMFSAVLSGAEVWVAKMLGKNVEGAMAVYARDLRMAFEADNLAPISGTRPDGIVVSGARALGYYSASGPDTGV